MEQLLSLYPKNGATPLGPPKHGIVQRDITSENILIPCEFSKFCRTFSLHSVAG